MARVGIATGANAGAAESKGTEVNAGVETTEEVGEIAAAEAIGTVGDRTDRNTAGKLESNGVTTGMSSSISSAHGGVNGMMTVNKDNGTLE